MQTAQFELHSDIEERHWWFVARRKIMRDVVHRLLPPSRSRVIVDVGCGTGANIAKLAEEYTCVGIDTSEEGIRMARERFPRVSFLHGYMPQDLDDQARGADLFLLMDVLEHIEDHVGFLTSLINAMKPGAQLLITVPANMSLWTEHDVSFGHYRRYEPATLAAVWEGLPVPVRLLSYFNTRLYPLIKGARTLSQVRGHAAGRAGTDFKMYPGPFNRMLTGIFAGESRTLINTLEKRSDGYANGASVMAVLQKM